MAVKVCELAVDNFLDMKSGQVCESISWSGGNGNSKHATGSMSQVMEMLHKLFYLFISVRKFDISLIDLPTNEQAGLSIIVP